MNKNILKTIWNERRINIALFIELFLISLFLWFVLDSVYPTIKTYMKPLGYNADDVYLVHLVDRLPEDPQYVEIDRMKRADARAENVLTIVERIRKHPDVAEVSLSIKSRPGIHHTSKEIFVDGKVPIGEASIMRYSPEAIRLYQLQEVSGNNELLTKALERGEFIVSESLARMIEEKGKRTLGCTISIGYPDSLYTNTDSSGIIGAVTNDIRSSRYDKIQPFVITNYNPSDLVVSFIGDLQEISIRPKAGREEGFANRFEEEMREQLSIGNTEFEKIVSLKEMNTNLTRTFEKGLIIKGILVIFLLINILLGVSGVFWYRTKKRRNQMGIRVALGDTPKGVLSLYYREGLLIFSVAFVLTIIVFVVLFNLEIPNSDLEPLNIARFVIVMVSTYILISAIIMLSIWLPGRGILMTPPAETLQES